MCYTSLHGTLESKITYTWKYRSDFILLLELMSLYWAKMLIFEIGISPGQVKGKLGKLK